MSDAIPPSPQNADPSPSPDEIMRFRKSLIGRHYGSVDSMGMSPDDFQPLKYYTSQGQPLDIDQMTHLADLEGVSPELYNKAVMGTPKDVNLPNEDDMRYFPGMRRSIRSINPSRGSR